MSLGRQAPAGRPVPRAAFAARRASSGPWPGLQTSLFDSGTADESKTLAKDLDRLGIKPGDLGLIVLSHGHADHAGGAGIVRDRLHAPIVVGQGDVEMLHNGRNRTLKPMSFTARLLRPFVDATFKPYNPDIEVTAPIGRSRVTPPHIVQRRRRRCTKTTRTAGSKNKKASNARRTMQLRSGK